MERIREWNRRFFHNRTLQNVPALTCFTIFLNVFFYSMSSTVVFSFLPKLVKFFGTSEVNTGTYAGIIASSVFVGRLFFSVLWGYLTDTFGKKNTAILTAVLLLIMTLTFGFSHNFYWAVTARFLQGCAQGQIIVSKSILADVCDDSNMAFGLSVVMTSFTVGIVVGPSVGGFLVFPNENYPEVFKKDNIFTKFPILLPNFIICLGLTLGICFTIKFISQDKVSYEKVQPVVRKTTRLLNKNIQIYGTIKEESMELSSSEPCQSTKNDDQKETTVSIFKRFSNNDASSSSRKDEKKKSKFLKALSVKECVLSCVLYGTFSLVDIGISEMFPILAATSAKYKGLGFTTENIGTVLMVASIFVGILQLTILPKLNNRYGSKKVLIASDLLLAFCCPLLPCIAAIENRIVLWTVIVLLILVIRACIFTCYLSINIFVNNSVEPDLLGSANGLAMTFASLGRLISPLVCGGVYSWSLRNIIGLDNKNPLGFPFNQFLVFFVLSICAVLGAVLTTFVPDHMNFKKTKVKISGSKR